MGKMKDLLNRIVLPPGLIMQSRIHGGYIVIVQAKRLRLGVPTEYACLNKSNNTITNYTLNQIDENWLITEYFDKTVKVLYGSKT